MTVLANRHAAWGTFGDTTVRCPMFRDILWRVRHRAWCPRAASESGSGGRGSPTRDDGQLVGDYNGPHRRRAQPRLEDLADPGGPGDTKTATDYFLTYRAQ